MNDVTSFEVTGDWRHIIDDGMVDGNDLPDEVPLTGKVEFKPVFPSVAIAGTPATAYTLGPVTALVAGGVLTDLQGRPGVKLAGSIGEHKVRWTATTTLRFQEQKVSYPSVDFELTADARLTGIIAQVGPSLQPIVIDPRIEALAARLEGVDQVIGDAEQIVVDAAQSVIDAKAQADRAVGLAAAQDTAIADRVTDTTSATHAAFKAVGNATYVQAWKPSTAYVVGAVVRNPDGESVTALTAHTSGAAFDASRWSAPKLTTKAEADSLAASLAEARSISNTGSVAQYDAAQARLTHSQDDIRASLTPDGRTAVTLHDGSSTSTIIATNATMSLDPNTKHGATSLKATLAGAVTATIRHTPTTPITHPPASIVHQWVYVPDPSVITSIGVRITGLANYSGGWLRSRPGSELRRGWNLLRYGTYEGILTDWPGTVTRLTFTVVTTAATSLLFSRGWIDCPPKAQILFVEDRGYVTFKQLGVPWFRANGFPICWALDPAINGSNAGTRAEAITDADVATFAAAGDEISLHSYAGEVTATMTPDQVVRDSVLAIKWIRDRGYKGSIWRAAWTQNTAVNAAAARPFFAAYATAANLAGYNTWPPVDPWAISRYGLHGRSPSDIDTRFARLKETRALDVQYTHGIHPDGTTGGADMTPAQWGYWTAKVQAGVAEGWLELVTFTQLLERSGGIVR